MPSWSIRSVTLVCASLLFAACSFPAANDSEAQKAEEVAQQVSETDDGGAAAIDAAPPEQAEVPAGTTWLEHVNLFRRAAGLSDLTEDKKLNVGAFAHARYMVRADKVGHDEDKKSPHYTAEGDESARSSNVLAADTNGRFDTSVEGFFKAPFHALGLLHPKLVRTGYGEFFEAGPAYVYAATLDVRHGMDLGMKLPDATYPVRFPADGSVVSVREAITEYPDPLTSCPNYAHPTGLPITVQLAPDTDATALESHTLTMDGKAVEHCMFDAKTYSNAKDKTAESAGRVLLDYSNAVVIIPRSPLVPKKTYAVSVGTGANKVAWSFRVANNAR